MRIIVTVSPLMYREAIALSIYDRRPDSEVLIAPPWPMDVRGDRFGPHVLVHDAEEAGLPPALAGGVACRVRVRVAVTRVRGRMILRTSPTSDSTKFARTLTTGCFLYIFAAASSPAAQRFLGHDVDEPCDESQSSEDVDRRKELAERGGRGVVSQAHGRQRGDAKVEGVHYALPLNRPVEKCPAQEREDDKNR